MCDDVKDDVWVVEVVLVIGFVLSTGYITKHCTDAISLRKFGYANASSSDEMTQLSCKLAI